MAIKTTAQLLTDITTSIVTNTNGLVTAAVVRQILTDIVDTLGVPLPPSGFNVVSRGTSGPDATQLSTIQYTSTGIIYFVDSNGSVFSYFPPSLAQVAAQGNTTTTSISARGVMVTNANNRGSMIQSLAVTENYVAQLPAKTGTIAFLDDIVANNSGSTTGITLSAAGALDDATPLTFSQIGGALIDVLAGETMILQGVVAATKDITGMEFFVAPFYATVSRSQDGNSLSLHSLNVLFTQQTGDFSPADTVELITYKPDDTQFTFRLICNTNGIQIPTHAKISASIHRQLSVGYVAPTIVDLALTTAPGAEGNTSSSTYIFTITRSGNTTTAFNVDYAVTGTGVNPANNNDFFGGVLPSGTISFLAGQTAKQVNVLVAGDTNYEQNETFLMTLSNPTNGVTLNVSTATATIVNEDAIPQPALIDITGISSTKDEGNSGTTVYQFSVSRSGNTNVSCSVNWAASGYTANPVTAADFSGNVFPSGTVNFVSGETSKLISVSIIGDTNIEEDEAFQITLSNPTNCTLNSSVAYGYVTNDDNAATIPDVDNLNFEIDYLAPTAPLNFDAVLNGLIASQYGWYEYEVDTDGIIHQTTGSGFEYHVTQNWNTGQAGSHTIKVALGTDADNIIDLIANDHYINSIGGLDLLTQLQILQLSGNVLTDLPLPLSNTVTLIDVSDNNISGAQTAALPTSLETLNVADNQITTLATIPAQVKYLYAANNVLTQANVDSILTTLDTNGVVNGVVELHGYHQGKPTASGLSAKASLEGDGWTVKVNESVTLSFTSSASDSSDNVTATIASPNGTVKFYFTPLTAMSGTPVTMTIRLSTVAVMTVDFLTDYLGDEFMYVSAGGVEHIGTFVNGNADF